MREIGGYLELELQGNAHYHVNALRLNTARNCLEYILRVRRYRKVYIPYYTCEAILEPFKKCQVKWAFYHINANLEPDFHWQLEKDEAFLYTNYFGLKQNCIQKLFEHYGGQLIVDNSQAFFAEPILGVDTFYSARKFFGVPDGAYLYINKHLDVDLETDVSFPRISHLLKRLELSAEDGYSDFQKSEQSLCFQPIKQMSLLTERLLSSIDYKMIRVKRRENFGYVHERLCGRNLLNISMEIKDVPMCYPFWSQETALRGRLLKNKIYVATYWPNIFEWCSSEEVEYAMAESIIPIPIDQRYNVSILEQIINDGKI